MTFAAEHPRLFEVLVSLAVLLGSYLAARLVSNLLGRIVARRSPAAPQDVDHRLIAALKRPVTYALFLLGAYVAVHRLPVAPRWTLRMDSVLFVFGVFILTLALARAYVILLDWYATRPHVLGGYELAREFNPLFGKVGRVFITLVALTILLQHFGVNVASLVVSLGVGSLAVGLAAQDTLSNMFAGFTLMLDRPFRVGDRIQLATGETGTVEAIGMRATLIRTPEQTILVVPNSLLVKERLVNHSRLTPHLTTRIEVGVAYGSDPDQVKRVLIEAAAAAGPAGDDRGPAVHLTRFGDFAIHFAVMVPARDDGQQAAARSAVLEAIYRGLLAAGIEIPTAPRPMAGGASAATRKA